VSNKNIGAVYHPPPAPLVKKPVPRKERQKGGDLRGSGKPTSEPNTKGTKIKGKP